MMSRGQEATTSPERSRITPRDPVQPTTLNREASKSGSKRTAFWLIALAAALVVYPVMRWGMTPGGNPVVSANDGGSELERSSELYRVGRYEGAVTAPKNAMAANPNSADAYNNLAVSYLALRKFDEATEAAREAIRLRPDFQLAKNNLAWIQQEKSKPAETAKTTRPAIAADQEVKAAALLNQSLEHVQAQRFQECAGAARQAVALNPSLAPAHNKLGFCLAKLNLWDEAIRSTEEAARLDPTMKIAQNNLTWMRQEQLKTASVIKDQ